MTSDFGCLPPGQSVSMRNPKSCFFKVKLAFITHSRFQALLNTAPPLWHGLLTEPSWSTKTKSNSAGVDIFITQFCYSISSQLLCLKREKKNLTKDLLHQWRHYLYQHQKMHHTSIINFSHAYLSITRVWSSQQKKKLTLVSHQCSWV